MAQTYFRMTLPIFNIPKWWKSGSLSIRNYFHVWTGHHRISLFNPMKVLLMHHVSLPASIIYSISLSLSSSLSHKHTSACLSLYFLIHFFLYLPLCICPSLQAEGQKQVGGALLSDAGKQEIDDGEKITKLRPSCHTFMQCCLVKWIINSTTAQITGMHKRKALLTSLV